MVLFNHRKGESHVHVRKPQIVTARISEAGNAASSKYFRRTNKHIVVPHTGMKENIYRV